MPKVIIVGSGIVGPVMAVMLKRKGYDPIIVERAETIEPVGLSLALWPNGLKVLSTIGQAYAPRAWREGLEFTADGEHLGGFDQSYFREKYGFASFGVRRTELRRLLVDCAIQEGITVLEGWELVEVRELHHRVVAIAKDGREIEASFIVGCDGLHSATRKWICEKHGVSEPPADYTGLVTTGGFCPTPTDLPPAVGFTILYKSHIAVAATTATASVTAAGSSGLYKGPLSHIDFIVDYPSYSSLPSSTPATPCGWYGNGKYVVTYEVDDTTSVWAMTMAGEDRRERWRDAENMEREKVKALKELEDWPAVIREMVASTDSIAKIGLYDRPSLLPVHWHHRRCVLVGDAAHTTSPHLGQGANQGLEDCWHLSQMLPDADEDSDLGVEALGKVFQKYAEKRQPRTAALVQGARAVGQLRVVSGEEACKQRNETMRKMYADTAAVMARLDNLYSEPF